MARNRALIACVLAALHALVCVSCAAPSPSSGTPVVYYSPVNGASVPLERREGLCPDGTNPIAFVAGLTLEALGESAPGQSAAYLEDYTLSDGVVTLLVSEDYGFREGYERTLADACLVLGLTEIEGIEGVVMTVQGEEGGTVPFALRADDYLWGSLDVEAVYDGNVRYFSDAGGRYAVAELRSIALREDETAERYLLLDLIAGPRKEGLYPVIPEGTALRSVATDNRICTVDFSQEFINHAAGTMKEARMTLCCVVNTLCALSTVDAVRILVEGAPLESYFGLDCREPLTADPFIPAGASSSSVYDIDLFYPDTEGRLCAIPVMLAAANQDSLARSAVELLCHGSVPLGLRSALPDDARVQNVSATAWGYIVDFSAGFSRAAPPYSPELALQAVVHVLSQFAPGVAVYFTQDGVALTNYQGYDLPARMTADVSLLG